MIVKHVMVRGKPGSGQFRSSEKKEKAWGHVAGTFMVTPEGISLKPRLCFMVVFADGVVDYWPVSDMEMMEFGS